MERSVETRDLRQFGNAIEEPTNRRNVVRLMQGSKRNQVFNSFCHFRIDSDRLLEMWPTVNNPVSDSDKMIVFEFRAQEWNQVIQCAVVSERCAFRPGLLRCGSVLSLTDEMRPGVDPST